MSDAIQRIEPSSPAVAAAFEISRRSIYDRLVQLRDHHGGITSTPADWIREAAEQISERYSPDQAERERVRILDEMLALTKEQHWYRPFQWRKIDKQLDEMQQQVDDWNGNLEKKRTQATLALDDPHSPEFRKYVIPIRDRRQREEQLGGLPQFDIEESILGWYQESVSALGEHTQSDKEMLYQFACEIAGALWRDQGRGRAWVGNEMLPAVARAANCETYRSSTFDLGTITDTTRTLR